MSDLEGRQVDSLTGSGTTLSAFKTQILSNLEGVNINGFTSAQLQTLIELIQKTIDANALNTQQEKILGAELSRLEFQLNKN